MHITERVALGVIASWLLCAQAGAAELRAEKRPTIAGEWKEHWGTPGQTDVTYHDEFRVELRKDGQVSVKILNREQAIDQVTYKGGRLKFVLHTTFAIEYDLALDAEDGWIKGSATTPEDAYPIKWERME
jgi:hypothetical protein